MNRASRYRTALLAGGWLLLLGLLLQSGLATLLRNAYGHVETQALRISQKLSDREGSALTKARGESRRAAVEEVAPPLTREFLAAPGQLLFGAYDGALPTDFSGLESLEQRLGYRFPIISFYQAWGDRPDQQHFPSRHAETISRLGSVPMITWEPWVKDFDGTLRSNLPPVAEREYASLAAIARGDYDFYVSRWASGAAAYGKPILLRFAHEMNDPYRYPWGPQNGNRTEDFIAAWRHVHLIFNKMGAKNVLWVWSPHISMPWFEFYYPGDEYVDWIGTGVLNYGDVATWSRWWSFEQILQKAYPAMVKFDKPLMISEFGSIGSGGDLPQWHIDAHRAIVEKYPAIRMVVFFNQPNDVTLSTAPLDWSLQHSPRAVNFYRAVLPRRISR